MKPIISANLTLNVFQLSFDVNIEYIALKFAEKMVPKMQKD